LIGCAASGDAEEGNAEGVWSCADLSVAISVRRSGCAQLPSKQASRRPFSLKNIPFHITHARLSSNDNR
jgi:hypothetical protein